MPQQIHSNAAPGTIFLEAAHIACNAYNSVLRNCTSITLNFQCAPLSLSILNTLCCAVASFSAEASGSLLAACRSASEPIGTPPTPWLPSADSAPGASISVFATAPHRVFRFDCAHKITQSGRILQHRAICIAAAAKIVPGTAVLCTCWHTPLQAETDSCSCVSSVKQHSSAFKQDKMLQVSEKRLPSAKKRLASSCAMTLRAVSASASQLRIGV